MTNKIFLSLMFATSAALAQAPDTTPAYRLEFNIKELEGGKVISSRQYSVNTAVDKRNLKTSLRTGSKVPIPFGEAGQTTYLDVGVNIDCFEPQVKGQQMSFTMTAEVSSIAQDTSAPRTAPFVRQNRWSSEVVLPIQKPTIVFSSDDLTTKRQMQMEVTAVPLMPPLPK